MTDTVPALITTWLTAFVHYPLRQFATFCSAPASRKLSDNLQLCCQLTLSHLQITYKGTGMRTFLHAPLSIGLLLANGAFAGTTGDNGDVETIVVVGTPLRLALEQELSLTPGGVTLVDSAELYERNISSMADMLRYVPGVWATSSSGGDAMFFSSRGSNLDATNYDMNGIKLMQDGLPVTTADGNNHNRMIDPLSANYATIARGANALTYGASTLGGAIDFISPTAHSIESELFLNWGSDGHKQGRLTGRAVAGDLDGIITLEAKERDGYRRHSEQNRSGLYANAGWRISDAVQTRLYLTYIDNEEELPGALTAVQFADDPYQAEPAAITGHYQVNVESWRVANKTEWTIHESSTLSFGLSYEEQSLYHPIVANILLIDTDQDNLGASLRYNFNVANHDILAGINYARTTVVGGEYRNNGGRRNGLTTVIDNKAKSLEAFLVDRWQFAPNWQLVYGIQLVSSSRDVLNLEVDSNIRRNPRADYDSVNPRVGIIYQIGAESEWFANLSRLYEAPTNYELQDDIRRGNATLDAMRGTVAEVGSRGSHSWGRDNQWNWEVALYYGRLKDEILSVDDPAAPGTSLSTNVDKTIHAGVEALVAASITLDDQASHRLEPRVSITLNEFSFDGDPVYGNNSLPAAPDYVIKGEILYRHTSGFFIGPTFDFVDERYADFSNSYTVDSYNLFGLRGGLSGSSWEAFAELRNLGDKQYVATHSVRNIASPADALLYAGEPRSAYVGVKLCF